MSPVASGLIKIVPSAPAAPGASPDINPATTDYIAFHWPAAGSLTARRYTSSAYVDTIATISPSIINANLSGTPTPYSDPGRNLGLNVADERTTAFLPRVPDGGSERQMLVCALDHDTSGVVQSHLWMWDIGQNTQAIYDIGSTKLSNSVHFVPFGASDGQPYMIVKSLDVTTLYRSVRIFTLGASGPTLIATVQNSPASTHNIPILGVTGLEASESIEVWLHGQWDDYELQRVALPSGTESAQTAGDEFGFGDPGSNGNESSRIHFPWFPTYESSTTNPSDEYGFAAGTFAYGSGSGMTVNQSAWNPDSLGPGLGSWVAAAATSSGAVPANTQNAFVAVNYANDTISICSFDHDTVNDWAVMKTLDLTAVNIGGAGWNSLADSLNLVSEPAATDSGIPHFAAIYGETNP